MDRKDGQVLKMEIFLLSHGEMLALRMEILPTAEAEILADSRYHLTTHWQSPQCTAMLPFYVFSSQIFWIHVG